jgi:DNA repair protein RecN (Recombination protein N)
VPGPRQGRACPLRLPASWRPLVCRLPDLLSGLERKPLVDGKVVVGLYGADEPEFHVSANKGEPLRPIVDVASGGELSRVMLAIKTVLAKADGVPAMVFDEIDTGIGGEVAIGVGEHLSALAEGRQVLCITHLASIAVRADNHIKVEKLIDGERTITRVTTLVGGRPGA